MKSYHELFSPQITYKHTMGNTHRNDNEEHVEGRQEQTNGLGHLPLEAGDGGDDHEEHEQDCNTVPGDPIRIHADAGILNGWKEDVHL